MTTSDPTRSPAGTESAWAYTHLPPGTEFTDDVIATQVERVEALVERHAPGIPRPAARLARPEPGRIWSDRNPNLVDGAVGGGTSSCTSN